MKNTYYHVGSPDEIATILRDGFVNNMKAVKQRGRRDCRGVCIDDSPTKPNPVYLDIKQLDSCGIYVTDAPGGPDPDYPNDQLLEITLPPDIDVSNLELVVPEKPARWREWIIPAEILNKHARVRQRSKDQWKQIWATYKESKIYKESVAREKIDRMMRGFDLLIKDGVLEIAKDAQGLPIYRRGEPAYKLSDKGKSAL